MDAAIDGQKISPIAGKEQLQARHYEAGIPLPFSQRHTDMCQAVDDAENNKQQAEADVPERQGSENDKGNPNQHNIDPEYFGVGQHFFAFRQLVDDGIDIALESTGPKVFLSLM